MAVSLTFRSFWIGTSRIDMMLRSVAASMNTRAITKVM